MWQKMNRKQFLLLCAAVWLALVLSWMIFTSSPTTVINYWIRPISIAGSRQSTGRNLANTDARLDDVGKPSAPDYFLADLLLRRWTNGSLESHVANLLTVAAPDAGLGNLLFVYASTMGIAAEQGMIPTISSQLYAKLSAAYKIHAISHPRYDELTWAEIQEEMCCSHSPAIGNQISANKTRNYKLKGFLQSFKYFRHIRINLRKKELLFRDEVLAEALRIRSDVTAKHCSAQSPKPCILIGVHNRRYNEYLHTTAGFLPGDVAYFTRAMGHYVKKYGSNERGAHIVFAIASNEYDWSVKHLSRISLKDADFMDFSNMETEESPSKSVTYSIEPLKTSQSAGVDLCFLTVCDHLIITFGTYSFWAAYLGKGEVVRMASIPRANTTLAGWLTAADYYPSEWVAL